MDDAHIAQFCLAQADGDPADLDHEAGLAAERALHGPGLDGRGEGENHDERDERGQTAEDNDGELKRFHEGGKGRKRSIAGDTDARDKHGVPCRVRGFSKERRSGVFTSAGSVNLS